MSKDADEEHSKPSRQAAEGTRSSSVWEWVGKAAAVAVTIYGFISGYPAIQDMITTPAAEIRWVDRDNVLLDPSNAAEIARAGTIIGDVVSVSGKIELTTDRLAVVANEIRFSEGATLSLSTSGGSGASIDVISSKISGGTIDVSGKDGSPSDDVVSRSGADGGALRVVAGAIENVRFIANGGAGADGQPGPDGRSGREGRCDGFGKWRPAQAGENGRPGQIGGNGGAAGLILIRNAGNAPTTLLSEPGRAGSGGVGGAGGKGGRGCTGWGGSQNNQSDGIRGRNGANGLNGQPLQPDVVADVAYRRAVEVARKAITDSELSQKEMLAIIEASSAKSS